MKAEDVTLLVILGVLIACVVIRTIAACGVWSNLKAIHKELKRGNDRASRFCDMGEYHNEFCYDDYFRTDHPPLEEQPEDLRITNRSSSSF